MLTLCNATKKFGGLCAVNNVSFNMKQGSIVGLIGPNGSGKTTLFNIISGVLPLTEGKVTFCGTDITTYKSYDVAKLGLVRTFQIVKPFNNITALENVMVGTFQKHHKRSLAEEKALQVMKLLSIDQYKDMLPKNLPLAIKKKLEIARIISTEPKLIMLDEVMGGLNPQESDELLDTIMAIRDTGITILIIEHKMKAIMKLSDDVIVLSYGKVIAQGLPEDVVKDEGVIKAYLGDDFDVKS